MRGTKLETAAQQPVGGRLMIGLAAFNVPSMLNAALLAALAMLLSSRIDIRRAFQSNEWETLVVLGAAIGLEAAVTDSGL